jgi:hypothetical protein
MLTVSSPSSPWTSPEPYCMLTGPCPDEAALKVLDCDESNNGVFEEQVWQVEDVIQRSAEPVSRITSNGCGLSTTLSYGTVLEGGKAYGVPTVMLA